MTVKLDKHAFRLLTLIYDLSDGKAGVPIPKQTLLRNAEAMNLFDMSDADFEEYRARVLGRVEKLKELEGAHALGETT